MMAKLPNRMQYAGLGVLAAVFFLSPGTESRSQARTAAPPDIYANFVGVWVGTDHYLKDGAEVTKPLRLTIEETKKKDAMRFMYEYGTKGQKDYSQPRRRITLNPSRAEMTSEWDDSAKDHWKALGLDLFAQKNLGLFRAVAADEENGKKVVWVETFDLGKDTFRYVVERSEDGRTFAITKTFVLNREAQPPGSSALQTH